LGIFALRVARFFYATLHDIPPFVLEISDRLM